MSKLNSYFIAFVFFLLIFVIISGFSVVYATPQYPDKGPLEFDPGSDLDPNPPGNESYQPFADNYSNPLINAILDFLFPPPTTFDGTDPIVLEYFVIEKPQEFNQPMKVTASSTANGVQRTLQLIINPDGSIGSSKEKITKIQKENNDDKDNSSTESKKPEPYNQEQYEKEVRENRERFKQFMDLMDKATLIQQQNKNGNFDNLLDIYFEKMKQILDKYIEINQKHKDINFKIESDEDNDQSSTWPPLQQNKDVFYEFETPQNNNGVTTPFKSSPWQPGKHPEDNNSTILDPHSMLMNPDGSGWIRYEGNEEGNDDKGRPDGNDEPQDAPPGPEPDGPMIITEADRKLILDNENNPEIQQAGDPFIWCPDYWECQDQIMHGNDSYDSKYYPKDELFHFDLDCEGNEEKVDRSIQNTLMLHVEIFEDGKVTCGREILFHHDLNSFEMVEIFDDGKDGSLDSTDHNWKFVNVVVHKGGNNWQFFSPETFGITGFNYSNHYSIKNDCFGVGVYSDGYDGYAKETDVDRIAYERCKADGGLVHVRTFEPDAHFRLGAANYHGVEYANGETEIAYGAVLGVWPENIPIIGDYRS